MTSTVSIHQIQERKDYGLDLAHNLFIFDQCYFPTPWDQASWANLFVERDYLLLALIDESTIVGICLFELINADSFVHLLKIVISPELRGGGMGRKILELGMAHLEAESYSHFFLEVEETNVSAIKLYQSLGLKVIHRKKDFYGEGRAALIMTKNS